MSSIMDELKTLQGKRDASRVGGDAGERPAEPPASPAPMLGAPQAPRRRRSGLVLGVLIALVALGVALVLPRLGGRSRAGERPTVAAADEHPSESSPDAQGDAVANAGGAVAHDAEPDATDDTPVALAEADTHEVAGAGATGVALVEPRDVDDTTIPEVADGASAPEEPADESAAPEEATARVEETRPELVKGAAPALPVRVLTLAEDEANKAAIRGLKVFGVLADEKGIGVYTSAGELREGSRFNEMDVTKVTSRYVILECGNKRYKWMLPRRRAMRAEGDAS